MNLVICDLANPLASGASADFVLNLTSPAGAGVSTVDAAVTSVTTDTNSGNNADAATVTVTLSPPPPPPPPAAVLADLSLMKTASVASATTGDRIVYTLTARNNGPDAAQDVIITDTLPTAIAFVSATGEGWSCTTAANVVSCARPTLASGTSATVQIVGTAVQSGRGIVNAGSITSRTPDPSFVNNTATATIDVAGKADLVVRKTASSATYVPGRNLSFTITVTNRGPDDVSGAHVRDIVPPQLESFDWTCSAVSGRCGSFSGRGAIDQLIDVRVGGSVVFTLSGSVRTAAAASIANSAVVSPPEGMVDPDLTNNRDRVAVKRGIVVTKLKVSITPPTATIKSGVPIKVKVVTTNIGGATANIVLTCVALPRGITVAKAKGGFALAGRYCWRTKAIVRGGHVTFRFETRGDSRLAGRVRLAAQAQASNARRVGDTSRLTILSGRVTHQGGYTG